MKKDRADRITLYVDRKVYQEYKMYAIMINKSISSLIEQFMRETLKEMKKGEISMNKEFNLEEAEEFIDNIYQHKFDNMEEILEDGTQVVHLGGLDEIKFTDFESASFTLLRGEQRLKHQVKKQKEAIDKTMDIINDYLKEDYSIYTENEIEVDLIVKLKNILKEVSE